MQAQNHWIPPAGPLGNLVEAARERVSALLERKSELGRAASTSEVPPFETSLRAAIARGTLGVVAEVKRSSPSKGVLNAGIDAARQAALFESGGAAAISILTEPHQFGGSPDDLLRARQAVALPLLKKDFHIHPIQATEGRALGASAILLIARALSPRGLAEMSSAARDAGLEIVVEIRDESELDRALAVDARVIGVNNRNLETLVIDNAAGERMIPLIPADRIAIAESGIRDPAGCREMALLGADAVLVGSALSAAVDPAGAVRALASIDWVGRGH